MDLKHLFTGICIALGLIILGICINRGLQSFSNKERVVTVKGLAEKDIKAVSAEISINYSFSGDEPKVIVSQIDGYTDNIKSYLLSKGYKDYTISDLNLTDRKSYYTFDWEDGKRIRIKQDRYVAQKSIRLKINDVEKASGINNSINIDLIHKSLTADVSTSYNFPELNSIKPELIAESTKNARTAGEQFAKDSQSRLGKIKTASQGQISIAGQYYDDSDAGSSQPANPYMERVRVVSTIVFFLED